VLSVIQTSEYVRDVLPHSFGIWGGERSFEEYASDLEAVARSPFGRRRPFTVGLREDGRIACSAKLYAREIRWGAHSLRATGIGAVFAQPEYRGRGYASAMLGAVLDAERAAGTDFAFLFSDLDPAFYERLGFVPLASRAISLRARSLDPALVAWEPLAASDWGGVRRCFEALDARSDWSFRRSAHVWDFLRLKWSQTLPRYTQRVDLVTRRGRAIAAYVLCRRVADRDTLVIDDFAFADDEARESIGPLLRAAAGDLARVKAWLPPPVARGALPRGSVRARQTGIFMGVALSRAGRTWFSAVRGESEAEPREACWNADHV
jgi:predicted N-acetyltransferase YhbS